VPGARIGDFLVQKMVKSLQEAITGLTRDPVVGPLITVGLGSVMTEIYRNIAIRPAPVSAETAHQMLNEVKGFALLRGYRNAPKGDLDALAQAVSDLSQLAGSDQVEEAEANPVAAQPDGQGVIFLDALVHLRTDGEKQTTPTNRRSPDD